MQLPPDMMRNTAAFISFVAMIIAGAGLILSVFAYASFHFFISSIQNAALSQIDTLSATASDAQQTLLYAADGAKSASSAAAGIAQSLNFSAQASGKLASALSSLSQNPAFSFVPQIKEAEEGLRSSSEKMQLATEEFGRAAASVSSAAGSLSKTAEDIGAAKSSILQSKESLKEAFSYIGMAGLLLLFVALALFSSVGMVALSVLLSHYPYLFAKKEQEKKQ